MADDEFTVATARQAAAEHRLQEWVARFLASPGSDNTDLAEILTARLHWWVGPVEVPFDRLHRLAGPAGQPVLCEIDDDEWDDLDGLERKVRDGWVPPPTVSSYADGQLVLEDGNHRVEAMRRAGLDSVWSVVGFTTIEERDRFVVART